MSDITTLMMGAAGAGGGGAETDPNFNQTTLLLHGDGTNGAQNNTFLDSSSNTFTITRNGNVTQGSYSPYGYGWSNYFDGTGNQLTASPLTDLALGAGDYTIELWVNISAFTTYGTFVTTYNNATTAGAWFLRINNTTQQWQWQNGANGSAPNFKAYNSSTNLTVGQWHHLAVVRSSGVVVLYQDGVNVGGGVDAETLVAPNFTIGRAVNGFELNGYLSNLRITKGTALYTTAFTPSTEPLTTTSQNATSSEVEILTCQSNRFVDNSSNTLALTVVGNPKVTPFSPFAPSAAYSASVNGGSGYFDGTGDYLSVADNAAFDLGTDNFTIQGWVYLTSSAASQTFVAKGTGADSQASYHIVFDGTNWDYYLSGNGSTWSIASGVLMGAGQVNAWQHIALVRNGSTFTPYVNGVAGTTTTSATALFDSNKIFSIGADDPGNQRLTGYISGLQVLKGTAATITVPTTPPTAIANTSLLCNFTNAGIFDNTGKNNLETVGNAQIDTSVKKYGTGSMEFDGSGDFLIFPNDVNTKNSVFFGSGDMTIETWVYPTTVSSYRSIFDYRPSSGFGTAALTFWIINGLLEFYAGAYSGGAPVVSGGSISTNVWTHIALCRASGTTRIYVNGTQVGTSTNAWNQTYGSTERFVIGATSVGASNHFTGYIDDFRITKGVARYTAAFTPPTAAFPDL